MRIKKFYVYYGGYFGGHTEIFKKGRDLYYYTCDFPIPPPKDELPENVIRCSPTKEQWEVFVGKIKPFASSWRKEYPADICDGTQWEVNIRIDDLLLKSWGSNAFPDDFPEFMKVLSDFTGIKTLEDDWPD